jgi:CBS domain-containing protein
MPLTSHPTPIDRAAATAARIDALVLRWHRAGLPIDQIAHRTSCLNGRLFSRVWHLLAPADLVANSCLVVMGSEGRGEQIVKTDQDNALLLRDGFNPAGAEEAALRFSQALGQLGYPPCPGGIMLSNPLWRQPLARFREMLREWVYGAVPEGPMRLAIFLDAAAVAGDTTLLQEARSYLGQIFADNDALLARFAAPADQFDEGGHWWTWFTRSGEQPIDLKKLGTFPIVHGVRALALQHHVRALGTAERLGMLVQRSAIHSTQADELTKALHALMSIKLDHQLQQRAQGVQADNLLQPATLEAAQRERLKDALAAVHRFRVYLRAHFNLSAL